MFGDIINPVFRPTRQLRQVDSALISRGIQILVQVPNRNHRMFGAGIVVVVVVVVAVVVARTVVVFFDRFQRGGFFLLKKHPVVFFCFLKGILVGDSKNR